MTYRTQAGACPRCAVVLDKLEDRDKWRCKSCVGALVGIGELEEELPEGETLEPREASESPLECPVCGVGMEPVGLAGVRLDQCRHDKVVWFDSGELGRVRKALAAKREAALQDERGESIEAALTRLLLG